MIGIYDIRKRKKKQMKKPVTKIIAAILIKLFSKSF
jgi:hypothetical protein